MKPLKKFFCLRLQTGVKTVCKSLVLLSAIVFILNLYFLDYQGPREETKASLGVVALFLVLATASAFIGHSGAERESLNMTFLSLGFLMATFLHWSIVATVSMGKGNIEVIRLVCIQFRCPETVWMIDLGFRTNKPIKKEETTESRLQNAGAIKPLANPIAKAVKYNINLTFSDQGSSDDSMLVSNQDEIVFNKKSNAAEGTAVKRTLDNQGFEKHSSGGGILFALGLLLLVVVFSYFLTCAIVICSYAAELYEGIKDFQEEEEEIDEQAFKAE